MRATDAYSPPMRLTIEARRSLDIAIARAALLDQLALDVIKARTIAIAAESTSRAVFWRTVAGCVENDIRRVRAPGWRP